MSDIELFAQHYNLDVNRLRDQGTGQEPLSIDRGGRVDFDGRIEAIRIAFYGRFGNTLYCLLNAMLIARALGIEHIQLPPLWFDGDDQPSIVSGDFTFSAISAEPPQRPTLIGQFFYPGGLEAVVGQYDASDLVAFANQYLRAIYRSLLDRVGSLGAHAVVLHFRGGDVFWREGFHNAYVQPPASYYLKSVDYACRRLGVDSASLVFEDRSNPAVDFVANELVRRGVSVSLQSASVMQDLVTIVSAHHVIAPYGTFCEAAAILAPSLETFTAFRRIASQRNISFWSQTKISEILRLRKIRTFIVDDPDETFTAPEAWMRTNEQVQLITSYGEHQLRHMEALR